MMLLKGFLMTDALVSLLTHQHGSEGNGKMEIEKILVESFKRKHADKPKFALKIYPHTRRANKQTDERIF